VRYHNHMFRLGDSGVCDSHCLQTSPDCSTTDFDFEDESAIPLFGGAKLLFAFENNVESIFYTAQSLREGHAGWQVGRSGEQEYKRQSVTTIRSQRRSRLCAGMQGKLLFQNLTLTRDYMGISTSFSVNLAMTFDSPPNPLAHAALPATQVLTTPRKAIDTLSTGAGSPPKSILPLNGWSINCTFSSVVTSIDKSPPFPPDDDDPPDRIDISVLILDSGRCNSFPRLDIFVIAEGDGVCKYKPDREKTRLKMGDTQDLLTPKLCVDADIMRKFYETRLANQTRYADRLTRQKLLDRKALQNRAKEVFRFNVEARGRWWKGEPTAKGRKGERKNYNMALRIMMALQAQSADHWSQLARRSILPMDACSVEETEF
jgi:hypothetical protein